MDNIDIVQNFVLMLLFVWSGVLLNRTAALKHRQDMHEHCMQEAVRKLDEQKRKGGPLDGIGS